MSGFGNRLCRIVAAGLFTSTLLGASALAAPASPDEPAPHAAALKVALVGAQTAAEGAKLHYEASGYRGLWISAEGDAARAEALLAALEGAGADALPVERYRVDALRQALETAKGGDPAKVAAAELALTRAFLTYARDVNSGLLEPKSVDGELNVHPERPDEGFLLQGLATAGSVDSFLAGLAPQDPGYAKLKTHLAALSAHVGDWTKGALGGDSIRPGEIGRRVADMRARLIALGDHEDDPAATATPNRYDPALVESVRAFQRRHGLNDDGVVGRRTFDAMNTSAEERMGQVVVNLERMRWMNRDLGDRHVYVNQADFTVQLVDRGEVLFKERVVVGKASRYRTPEFSDRMRYLVFNPTWHLPRSIATEEILPKLKQDALYLQKRNMRLVPRDGGAAPDPLLTDWRSFSASNFPYRIKQSPGGGNALGRVKFMFPNRFAIYLHDTPTKRLFRKDARAFSHGCIRVQDPMELARLLLSPQQDDPSAFIDRLLAGGKETTVNLEAPVPVHLTYRTVWIDQDGAAQYRADIYGRDGRVLNALAEAGVSPLSVGG